MTDLKPAPGWIVSRPIAHRGYHNLSEGRAENSIAAFKAALKAGFSIECDVQWASNGEPIVFHDRTLQRMTGLSGNIRDKTPEELAEIKLAGTKDGICTLQQHLDLVAGRVPLILELKGQKEESRDLIKGVAKALENYEGEVCVMSFAHNNCKYFKDLMPSIPRGLTAQGDDSRYQTHQQAMEAFDLQFVSYNVLDLPNKFVRLSREAGLPIITWTVNDEKTRKTTFEYADQMTFEEFDPLETGRELGNEQLNS